MRLALDGVTLRLVGGPAPQSLPPVENHPDNTAAERQQDVLCLIPSSSIVAIGDANPFLVFFFQDLRKPCDTDMAGIQKNNDFYIYRSTG